MRSRASVSIFQVSVSVSAFMPMSRSRSRSFSQVSVLVSEVTVLDYITDAYSTAHTVSCQKSVIDINSRAYFYQEKIFRRLEQDFSTCGQQKNF